MFNGRARTARVGAALLRRAHRQARQPLPRHTRMGSRRAFLAYPPFFCIFGVSMNSLVNILQTSVSAAIICVFIATMVWVRAENVRRGRNGRIRFLGQAWKQAGWTISALFPVH
jgi:hypothetical protein